MKSRKIFSIEFVTPPARDKLERLMEITTHSAQIIARVVNLHWLGLKLPMQNTVKGYMVVPQMMDKW